MVIVIGNGHIRDFVHQLTAGTTLHLAFGQAGAWDVSLIGATSAWQAIGPCLQIVAPAIVASLAPTRPSPAIGAAPPTLSSPVVESPPATSTEIALTTANGVKQVWGIVNGTATIPFILDSGAAEVVLPAKIAETLRQAGSLTLAEYRGTETYLTADGRQAESARYKLHSVTIGGRTVTDVLCVVVNGDDVAPLLGQSFLSRLGSWSIDNARQTLVLGEAN